VSLELRTRAWLTNAISVLMAQMVAPLPLPMRSATVKTSVLPEHAQAQPVPPEFAVAPIALHAHLQIPHSHAPPPTKHAEKTTEFAPKLLAIPLQTMPTVLAFPQHQFVFQAPLLLLQ